MYKFKVGDKVRIVNTGVISKRKYVGRITVVRDRFSINGYCLYFLFCDNGYFAWPEKDLEAHEAEAEYDKLCKGNITPNYKFNVGDTVQIIQTIFSDKEQYIGQVTTVTSRTTLAGYRYYLLACDDGPWYWAESDLAFTTETMPVTEEEFGRLLRE